MRVTEAGDARAGPAYRHPDRPARHPHRHPRPAPPVPRATHAASAEYQTVKLTGVMNYHVEGQLGQFDPQQRAVHHLRRVIHGVPTTSSRPSSRLISRRHPRRSRRIGRGQRRRLAANLSQYHIIVDDIEHRQHCLQPRVPGGLHPGQTGRPAAGPDRAADPRPEQDPGRPGGGPGPGAGRFPTFKLAEGQAAAHDRASHRAGHRERGAGRLALGPAPSSISTSRNDLQHQVVLVPSGQHFFHVFT